MKREDLFERLEPPPGGLARLRARARGHSNARWKRLSWGLAPVLATAALFVVYVRHAPDVPATEGVPEPALGQVHRSPEPGAFGSEDLREREQEMAERASSDPPDDLAFGGSPESEGERAPADRDDRPGLELDRIELEEQGASRPSAMP